jgi:CHAD domain-containing protein
MSSLLETERAYTAPQDAVLPDLTAVPGVSAQEPAGEAELDATYFDTPGLVLLRAGVTLRRRTGGADEGWHLKLPTDDPGSRLEVHGPLGEGTESPPGSLLTLVDGWTRGIAPAPVARIRTRRVSTRLVGPDGHVLAEVADDHVVALPAQLGAAPVEWREWEVELVEGRPDLLDAIDDLLAEHGVGTSPVQRKIELVLGRPRRPEAEPATRKGPARLLLHPYLVTQVREVELLDPVVRQDLPGGIHGMRKACRRLRAVLGAYRPLLDEEQTEPIRTELRWLARAMGEARDHQVVQERVEGLLDQHPEELVVGPVAERLQEWGEQGATHSRHLTSELLSSPRYHALRAALDELVLEPPWTDKAETRADKVLPRRIRKEWRRVRRRRRQSGDPHELRKAAKRLRHALEVLEPVWGKRAVAPRKAAQGVTQVLGERQDTVATRAVLVDLSRAASGAGEDTFTYGRLHAEEERHEAALLGEARGAWRDLKAAVKSAGW